MVIDFKHIRQQWPVGHGFFHTANLQFDNHYYRYVYDCGSGKSLEGSNLIKEQIARYVEMAFLNGDDLIDMLVVSHFHADHINGIAELLRCVKVKKLVLPHLDKSFRIGILAELISEGFEVWSELSGLIVEPARWVAEKGGRDFEIIEIDDEGEAFPDQIPRNDVDTRVTDGLSRGRFSHKSHCLVFYQSRAYWRFKFYVKKDNELALAIVQHLCNEFGLANADDLLTKLTEKKWIVDNWKAIRDQYRELVKKDRNVISLCMYSGPLENRCDWRLWKTCSCCSLCNWNNWCCTRVGWLATGDAELKGKPNFDDFERHYADELPGVDTLTIPHHGSADNFDRRFSLFGRNYVITGPSVNSKKHHPAESVVLDLNMGGGKVHIVTAVPETQFAQRFEGCLLI